MNRLITLPYESHFDPVEAVLLNIMTKEDLTKVCYISLNKSFAFLKKVFKAHLFDKDRIFVVDAATRAFHLQDAQVKDTPEVVYVDSQDLFGQLEAVQENYLDAGQYNYVILDSLSTLMIYKDGRDVAAFATRLVNRMALNFCDVYFTCSKGAVKIIEKYFEEGGVRIIQDLDNEYVLKFTVERFMDLIYQMDQAITSKDKKKAQRTYAEMTSLYRSLGKGQVDQVTKTMLYKKSLDFYAKLKGM